MSKLKKLFGAKTPTLPAPQPLPTTNDTEVEDKAKKARESAKQRRGITSTVKTGGLGVTGTANVQRSRALGKTGY